MSKGLAYFQQDYDEFPDVSYFCMLTAGIHSWFEISDLNKENHK
jgi:hypothetical protein